MKEIYTVEALQHALAGGLRPKYLYFWGHRPRVPGQIDKSCLSNWYPASFEVDGQAYPSVEHYMMASKARLFGDQAREHQVLKASSPGEAKSIGRKVRGFEEETWRKHRFQIVTDGCVAKFLQNLDLKEFLLTTGSRVLVEASPVDRIWGIGMASDDPNSLKPSHWRGENLLGFALMQARTRLNEQLKVYDNV